MDVADDVYVIQMEISQNQFVHGLTFSFTDETSKMFGEKKRGDKQETWDFTPQDSLVGFTGQYVGNRLSKVGTVTLNPGCGAEAYTTWFDQYYPPEPEVVEPTEPMMTDDMMEDESSMMPIVTGIVAIIIVLIIVAAVVVACKNKRKNNMIAVANSSVASVTDDSKTANPTRRDDLELPSSKPYIGDKATQVLSEDESAANVASAKAR